MLRVRLPRHTRVSSTILFGLLCFPLQSTAHDGIRLQDAVPGNLAHLPTGDQLAIDAADGPLTFAGRELTASKASMIAGYASEVAYVAVVSGTVRTGTVKASAGDILLILPYGAEASRERFDASRLAAGWTEAAQQASPKVYARLKSVAGRQRAGIFLGRYAQTGFNVAASGAASQELARRSVIGADAVKDIRFSGETDPAAIERKIVTTFLGALASQDVETVAALFDPMAFGAGNIGEAGQAARLAMAQSLARKTDWSQIVGPAAPERTDNGNVWQVTAKNNSRITIVLRPVGDFAYVQTISRGN